MSSECNMQAAECGDQLRQEFKHLKSKWIWLFLFGILLVVCGTAAIVSPTLTRLTTLAVPVLLGLVLIIAGVTTLINSFWAGKWSGTLVQWLVGILYIVAGFAITEKPLQAAAAMTLFVAALFIVMGIFRVLAALTIRFPHWGWALLNGTITFVLGVIIFRHFTESALWVLGLLIGLEMLFNGWTWIMISLAVKKIPDAAA